MNKSKLIQFITKFDSGSGKSLPPERELAKQLGMSRGDLRKSIGLLRAEGLIESRRGSGNYVISKKHRNSINIGVIFSSNISSLDYHFKKATACIKTAAKKHKCGISIIESVNSYFLSKDTEEDFSRLIKGNKIDGALIMSTLPHKILTKIDSKIPCVLVNNRLSNYQGDIPCVDVNHFSAGFLAAKYFSEQGHKKIGYISRKQSTFPILYHKSGLKSACSITGLKFAKENDLTVSHNYNSSITDIRNFFKKTKARAFYVTNDYLLAKIIRILIEGGYKIPENFKFIGTGNYSEGILCPLKLTTIDLKLDLVCDEAMQSLKDRLRNKSLEYHKLIEPEIIVRESA